MKLEPVPGRGRDAVGDAATGVALIVPMRPDPAAVAPRPVPRAGRTDGGVAPCPMPPRVTPLPSVPDRASR